MNKITALILVLLTLVACSQGVRESEKPVAHEGQKNTGNNNLELVDQFFEHFNNHAWASMADMYVDPAEFKDPSLGKGIVKQTREQIIEKYSDLNDIFPDIHDKVINVYPSGEKHVIVEFVSTGTAPDSSRLELPLCMILTFDNGLITKDFTYFDQSM